LRQADAVGSHIGDQPVFIQALRRLHRLARGHPQLSIGFLLQRTRFERGIRFTGLHPGFERRHLPRLDFQPMLQFAGGWLVEKHGVDIRFQLPGVLVKVLATGNSLSINGTQPSLKRSTAVRRQSRLQIPIRP